METNKAIGKSLPKPMMKFIALIVLVIVVILTFRMFVGHNDNTKVLVKQAFITGEMSCIDHAGWYWRGFGDIFTYEKSRSFYFNSSSEKVRGEGWEGDDTDEDDFNVTLSRNSVADISGFLKYSLPTNCEKLINLHTAYHSDDKVKHDLIRNATYAAVSKTAPLFTAEEAKVTKIAEFRRIAADQLTEGEYLAFTEEREEAVGENEYSADGSIIKKAETQKYVITRLKLDSLGHRIVIKQSPLTEYGISVVQFEIQKVKPDAKTQQQLDITKEREMKRVANVTEAETAKQEAITAAEKGKAKVAAERAEQEVIKIREVTRAEKERDVAVITAEKEKEVARLGALKALEDAKRIKAEGEAEAYANKAKVAAGLTPQEKAEWEYKTKVGIAAEIAKIQLPQLIVGGGEGKGGSLPMDMMSLKFATELMNSLSK